MGKAISKRHIQVSGGRATGTDGKKDKPTTTPTAGSLISIPQIEVSVQKESQSTDTCDDVAAGLTSYATDNSDNPQRKKVAKDTVNDLTGLTYRQCKAVQKSWKALTASNPNQLGVQFFMRFFLNYPDYRNFYSNFRSDSDTSNKEVNRRELRVLRDTATMHDLAAAYMESLTTIFNMLDNQDEVMVILDSLTDRHLPRGVLSLHFQDRTPGMGKSTRKGCMEEAAWPPRVTEPVPPLTSKDGEHSTVPSLDREMRGGCGCEGSLITKT
ncbi:uncharacterized protein [Littorina saxatilis]|uniref:Globin n=1 Tax=Littorina saxatilis TaxID=31220 RepID=A0AAN9BAG5_9CAEN